MMRRTPSPASPISRADAWCAARRTPRAASPALGYHASLPPRPAWSRQDDRPIGSPQTRASEFWSDVSLLRSFDELVTEAAAVPVKGWDFSGLDGRATEQRPSWGYQRLLGAKLAASTAGLDIQTGGGEAPK